jgi:hypothetical protein
MTRLREVQGRSSGALSFAEGASSPATAQEAAYWVADTTQTAARGNLARTQHHPAEVQKLTAILTSTRQRTAGPVAPPPEPVKDNSWWKKRAKGSVGIDPDLLTPRRRELAFPGLEGRRRTIEQRKEQEAYELERARQYRLEYYEARRAEALVTADRLRQKRIELEMRSGTRRS